ncbi:MAG: hypothetical protein OEV49_13625 [candidate division Zixibacteria bacterium]|nr:hypothetical protein [candidate division Zixibacteria bacterium]MDH3936896.1 hypothetical protein [candidate division Zixibacteria bacterium]MDH4034049.1 hypothetical protein [candidate division Zixibacteria bacterium]
MRVLLSVVVLLIMLSALTAVADVPSVMSYQGVLTDGGGSPVADGSYSVLFSIYDVASGGSAIWSETQSVSTTDGAFAIMLGSVNPLDPLYFAGADRFLGVKVGSDPEISPRTEFGSVPFAFSGTWRRAGYFMHPVDPFATVLIGADTIGWGPAQLEVTRTSNSTAFIPGVHSYVKNSGNGGGIAGDFEVEGKIGSVDTSFALRGTADITLFGGGSGVGVAGTATTSLGGHMTAGQFDAYNFGSTSGRATALGLSSTSTGSNWTFGLDGDFSSESGPCYGMDLTATSTNHGCTGMRWDVSGVFGTTGLDMTVSSSAATSTYGVRGEVTSQTGNLSGLRMQTDNQGSGDAIAVEAQAWNSGSGGVTGVWAYAEGNSTSSVYGLRAQDIRNSGSGATYGVYGSVNSTGSGTHYGVFGFENAGGSGAAVYASGDMIASGAKPAVVRTSQGENLMYATEATEIWFEDIGRGQLQNGSAHIELDPLYLETVVIDDDHPMEVFIQLRGDCNGTYVSVGTTGFDVVELQSGSSDASFTYRVMAKRKGYENERMRPTTVGWMDKQLYPERAAEIEAALSRPADR